MDMDETKEPIQRLREELSRKPLFSERSGYKPLDREPLLAVLDEIEAAYVPREEHDERIAELDAELEAEREESAFFEAERDRLYKVLADMESTHMKLPVDADGAPIRLGDEVSMVGREDGVVASIEVNDRGFAYVGIRPHGWDVPTRCTPEEIEHVKPETVEGIVAEAMSLACEPEAPYSKNSTLVKTYVERIRKAVEHDSRDQ